MTSEARRFPIVLTLVTAVALAILTGLGVWQLQRAQWKEVQLARIATLRAAPAQPIGPVLSKAAAGQDVAYTRVTADCIDGPPLPTKFLMSSDQGEWIQRPLSLCRLDGTPFDAIQIDRGHLDASRGSTSTAQAPLPAPRRVVGVLWAKTRLAPLGAAHPAPSLLVVERETPPVPGVTPAPYAGQAPANLEYVGLYAPTWFGLAGVLACVYAAMLWRRVHPAK
ncbi:MAG: SURF1 family cytochrome oxidase biogenesis protein [Caulobacterales bacterium]